MDKSREVISPAAKAREGMKGMQREPDCSSGEGFCFSLGKQEDPESFAAWRTQESSSSCTCQLFPSCLHRKGGLKVSPGCVTAHCLCEEVTASYRQMGLLGLCHSFMSARLSPAAKKAFPERFLSTHHPSCLYPSR